MASLKEILNLIPFVWFTIVFLTSGLCVNLLQLLVLPLFWINRYYYHLLIEKLCYAIYSTFIWLVEWWGNSNLEFYGDKYVLERFSKRKSFITLNHYGDLDWLVGWVFSERLGGLGGTRVFLKEASKYFPVMGWCWWFAEYGFMKRNWNKDEATLQKTVKSYQQNKVSHNICLYCEGTRRTDSKLLRSNENAAKEGRQQLKYHLHPRTKGFAYLLYHLRDEEYDLYDVEIAFKDVETATFTNLLYRKPIDVAGHVRLVTVPSTAVGNVDGAAEFCHQIYKEKDAIMDYYVNNKKFPGEKIELPRRKHNLIMFIVNNLVTAVVLITFYPYCVAAFGRTVVLSGISISCVGAFVLLLFVIRFTQSQKSSNFSKKTS